MALEMSSFSGLQAVDFLPQMTAPTGPSDRPEYESFFVLVQRANHFLKSYPQVTVRTCESVEFLAYNKGQVIDTTSSIFEAKGERQTQYIRALRLWTQEKPNHDNRPQEIGYVNYVPQVITTEQVEGLDSVVARINQQLAQHPLPGKIITLETQPVKWGSKGLDPDRSIWTERGWNSDPRFVNIIRMFYICGPPQPCQIGLQDFVPSQLNSGGVFSNPVMETFQPVLQRARQWLLSVPPNCRPVNVQTVTFRWSYNKGCDTKDMMYHENKKELNYLRYLRVGYVVENPAEAPPMRSTIQLGSKFFIPKMVRPPRRCCDWSGGQYETQMETRAQVDAWVKATGARVVSVESLVMRIMGGGETRYGFEGMHTWNETISNRNNRRRADEKFAHFYRIYTDGYYPDPAGWVNSTDMEQNVRAVASIKKKFFIGLGVLVLIIWIPIVIWHLFFKSKDDKDGKD